MKRLILGIGITPARNGFLLSVSTSDYPGTPIQEVYVDVEALIERLRGVLSSDDYMIYEEPLLKEREEVSR